MSMTGRNFRKDDIGLTQLSGTDRPKEISPIKGGAKARGTSTNKLFKATNIEQRPITE